MSSSPAPAAPHASANLFEFATHSGKTKITYYPFAPGPIVQGRAVGPLFQYNGPEGDLAFRGSQVEQEDTPLGKLLSVVLKPQADAGSLTFSLFLPPVVLGASKSQNFTTYGVKTHHAGNIEKPGAQLTYETECLDGDAKAVMLPL
jgi:hypothetical protein